MGMVWLGGQRSPGRLCTRCKLSLEKESSLLGGTWGALLPSAAPTTGSVLRGILALGDLGASL